MAPKFALTTECEQKIASCDGLLLNRSFLVAFSYYFLFSCMALVKKKVGVLAKGLDSDFAPLAYCKMF